MTDRRQGLCERQHPPILRLVTDRSPTRMVAVLFAAARVTTGGLKMGVFYRCDPDVGPCRRDGERFDSLKRRAILHEPSVGVAVDEPLARGAPFDPGLVVGGIAEPRAFRRYRGFFAFTRPVRDTVLLSALRSHVRREVSD